MENGVISFSGGKDSTAMLLMMIEKSIPFDKILFIDTTKEFPEMYDHIEKVEKYIYPHKIDKLEIKFDYWFGEHVKTRGKRKGEVGYGWVDFRNRWCTGLKRRSVLNYIGKDTLQFHGIAYDEQKRLDKNLDLKVRYPLVDWKITEKEALEYCYSKGFDWGGLYEKFDRVSCYVCPLARIGELRIIYNEYPHLWNKIEEMDKLSFRKFRSDYSVDELVDKFNKEKIIG